MSTDLSHKNPQFICEPCDLTTNNKKDYKKHLLTRKHINKVNPQPIANKCPEMSQLFKCDRCNKEYESRSGLWRHKKICIDTDHFDPNSSQIKLLTTLVIEVIKNNNELQKQNQELNKQVVDVCQKIQQPSSTVHNRSHNNNKTFNMQFFLNEQCKDAMNIMDFVNTFQLQFSDLEKVGEVGYVEGMSNIIINKLNELDIYKRPIHCSDAKRETTYVKDKNVWEKENGNRDRLRLAIRHITKKNTDMIMYWFEAHPGSGDSDNYLNDVYIQIVRQAMGAGDIEENENKIMRKITRSVLIEKE